MEIYLPPRDPTMEVVKGVRLGMPEAKKCKALSGDD